MGTDSQEGATPPPESPFRFGRRARWLVFAGSLILFGLMGVWFFLPALMANYHLNRAEADLAGNRPREAQAHLTAGLGWVPDHPGLLVVSSRTARMLDNLGVARALCQRLQGLQKGPLPEEMGLEMALVRVQSGDTDELAPGLRRVVDAGAPESALILEAMSRGLLRTMRLPAAEGMIRLWQARDPGNPRAAYFLGFTAENLGARNQAEAAYRESIRLDPGYGPPVMRLANLLKDRSSPAEAAELYLGLIERGYGAVDARANLGLCLVDLDRMDEAKQILAELQGETDSGETDSPEVQLLAVRIDLTEGRPEDALPRLDRILRRTPGDYLALFLRHSALRRLGRAEEAQAAVERLNQTERDNVRLAEIWGRDYSRNPDSPELLLEIAEIYERVGELGESASWLAKAAAAARGAPALEQRVSAVNRRLEARENPGKAPR